jgi:hypothetical protein
MLCRHVLSAHEAVCGRDQVYHRPQAGEAAGVEDRQLQAAAARRQQHRQGSASCTRCAHHAVHVGFRRFRGRHLRHAKTDGGQPRQKKAQPARREDCLRHRLRDDGRGDPRRARRKGEGDPPVGARPGAGIMQGGHVQRISSTTCAIVSGPPTLCYRLLASSLCASARCF